MSPVSNLHPEGGGPGDSALSGPSTNDRDQDVPLPTAPSPANSLDPAVIQTDEINEIRDEINETKEKKLNGREKNEKLISSDQEMDKDKVSDKDKDEKMDEGDESNENEDKEKNSKNTASRKSKRIRSPNISPNKELFPAKKKSKITRKYQTTRRVHVGKHINHITNKKKNKICIDCKKMEVEECWLCGKEEHVCEMALPKTQVD